MHDERSKGPGFCPLGERLTALFCRAETARREVEERWLADLRQYKGQYDPEVSARLHPKRSRAFLRLTRAKVKSVDARLLDLLFPGSGEANWAIEPVASKDRSRRDVEACEMMARRMRDQLAGLRYREIVRQVVHSGNLYGTGVLKGPLVERRSKGAWEREGGAWRLKRRQCLRPFVEFVPLWDIYPDMAARSLAEARFVFQRHLMSRADLAELCSRPGFDKEAVRAHLASHPQGDAGHKNHERSLSDMSGAATLPSVGEKFEVLEYWGEVSAEELGLTCGEEASVPANVWLLGGRAVKAVPSPLTAVRTPYYFYYFDKDETSVFGEGLAQIMRDPQQLFNAAVRAMLDNAAISAGPQIEVNQDLIPENEDPSDIFPFRVWLRNGLGGDAQAQAVRVFSLPSHTQELMAMASMFEGYAHETTGLPSPLAAELDKGAGQTVRGLSMLLSQASMALKDQVKHFDDGITKPFITALYHWNMCFSDDEPAKGDFEVRATGSASLMARELHVEQLDAFARATANSLDAPWIKRGELLRRLARARDLGEDVVRSETEMRKDREEEA